MLEQTGPVALPPAAPPASRVQVTQEPTVTPAPRVDEKPTEAGTAQSAVGAKTSAVPSPSAPATSTPDLSQATESYLPAEAPSFVKRPAPVTAAATKVTMRGAPMRTAKNMDISLEMPTATSVRTVPMKLTIDHRTMINSHLARTIGGKVSFTHLIGYAMVRALMMVPAMNVAYENVDGKATLVEPETINLGIAIDQTKPDGTRQLVVPNIRSCEQLTFGQFWNAYEAVVKKARSGTLTVDDFAGTTATLTNPGGIGTNHSIPRLMSGQGLILGVGSIEYAPGYLGASPERLNEFGVSKIMTLTSTYDHRVIQGAQSGEFLRVMEQLLLGKHGFYDDIFTSLRIPYAPLEWDTDIYIGSAPEQVDKEARVLELIAAYRALRPPHGRHRPPHVQAAAPPRARPEEPRPHAVGPRPDVPVRLARRQGAHRDDAARRAGDPARRVLPPRRRRVHAHRRRRASARGCRSGWSSSPCS